MAVGKFFKKVNNAIPERQFDDEKKRQIITEINGGLMRVIEACRAYGVSRHYVYTLG
jgi:hypothetical protein